MNSRQRIVQILVVMSCIGFGVPARAAETYFFEGSGGRSVSFSLLGGQYNLYLYAKRPLLGGYAPESRQCIFGGNFQPIFPTPEVISLGSGITISSIVPHKIGPVALTLQAGLYSLYIATLTSCPRHFVVESTNQNPAGVAPVRLVRKAGGSADFSPTASVRDRVQFYAQYRTDHGAHAPASGRLQIIHEEKVVAEYPLSDGHDTASGASARFVDVQWDERARNYVGKNVARFIVRIGGAEFTSTAEFTLTQ